MDGDFELFDKVQRRMRDGGRRLGKSKKKEFAFAGLLRCADCGHALTPMLIDTSGCAAPAPDGNPAP